MEKKDPFVTGLQIVFIFIVGFCIGANLPDSSSNRDFEIEQKVSANLCIEKGGIPIWYTPYATPLVKFERCDRFSK